MRTTYASKLLGEEPARKEQVLEKAERPDCASLSAEMQLGYFGHLIRRPKDSPIWGTSYDAYLKQERLRGVNREGTPRELWSVGVPSLALDVWA
eukprot:9393919-Alexandrium_andersonii.AAC.1